MAVQKDNQIRREISSISHLILISTLTLFSGVLILLNRILGWELWMIPIIAAGTAICLGVHIAGKGSSRARIYAYSLFLMFEAFYYSVNMDTLYDSTAMIVIMVFIFALTGERLLVGIGAFCGLSGVVTHLLIIGNTVGLNSDASGFIRASWQIVLILLGSLLAGKTAATWANTERQYTDHIRLLQETNAHANHFLANVSHEIRTPVNAVMGLAAIMEKEEMPQSIRRNVLAIREAGHRVAEQIADIMDYTEIDMKKLSVTRERYMITSIVNDLLTQLGFFENYGLDLVIDLATDVPLELIGDGTKIKKILWHLITNGFKFTKNGGVNVRIYAKKREYGINLVLEVTDTGIGMNEKELEHVSDRFYQSDSGLSRTAGGLGLGIPIINGFARSMNGFLHIESTPGEGTVTRVSVPQEIADAAPCISVQEKEKLYAVGFLGFKTTHEPRIKQFYMEMIDHFVKGLGVSFHRVISKESLEKLNQDNRITHLFVGTGEYEDNRAYIDSLAASMNVILVEDQNYCGTIGQGIALLKKPFCGMQVANFLNHMQFEALDTQNSRMVCSGVHVLVVDDDPMNLLVAKGIFSAYEMTVSTANSGRESIECCRTTDYDIVFMDHMMPGMDGVEAMKQIRLEAQKNHKESCIVALTANASSSAKEMFLSEGFDAFLPKPIELMELERVLKHVLPRSAVTYIAEEPRREQAPGPVRKEEAAAKPADPYCDLRAFGVKPETGLEYCQGDEKFYRSVLAEYAKERAAKIAQLKAFYSTENWKDYAIRVHSVKSSSKMIGADALSEQARTLELAAKEQNTAVIHSNHAAFLAAYARLLDLIAALLGDGGASAVSAVSAADAVTGSAPADEEEALEFAPAGEEEALEFAPAGEEEPMEFLPDDGGDEIMEFAPEGGES